MGSSLREFHISKKSSIALRTKYLLGRSVAYIESARTCWSSTLYLDDSYETSYYRTPYQELTSRELCLMPPQGDQYPPSPSPDTREERVPVRKRVHCWWGSSEAHHRFNHDKHSRCDDEASHSVEAAQNQVMRKSDLLRALRPVIVLLHQCQPRLHNKPVDRLENPGLSTLESRPMMVGKVLSDSESQRGTNSQQNPSRTYDQYRDSPKLMFCSGRELRVPGSGVQPSIQYARTNYNDPW